MHKTWTNAACKVAIIAVAGCFIFGFILGTETSKTAVARAPVNPGHIETSGSYNTRIYVTGLTPVNHTQKQNGTFTLTGYVTVANISSGKWESWRNVNVALKMDNSFIWQANGSIVKAITNRTGNFTLNYRVTFNHTIGIWSITAGLSPIPNYNYTYNSSSVTTYSVTITADVIIPKTITYTPTVFFNNDPFNISGHLLTKGNVPVVGNQVIANFGSLNFTSTATDTTGYFLIKVPALGSTYGNKTTLNMYFNKSGYYNALTMKNFTTVKFLNQIKIQHTFMGELLLNSPTNPKPRNTTLVIEGIFTYNATLFGAGDGYIKNKQLFIRWMTSLGVEFQTNVTTTDNFGHYLVDYKIPISEPASLPYSNATLKIVLDTTPFTNNFTRNVSIAPKQPIAINVDPSISYPIFMNEPLLIEGNVTPRVNNMEIAVNLSYSNSIRNWSTFYNINGITDGSGHFSFSVQASYINSTLNYITIIANRYEKLNYLNASFGPVVIHFIPDKPSSNVVFNSILIDGFSITKHPDVIQGSIALISGYILSNVTSFGSKPIPIKYQNVTIVDQSSGGKTFTGVTDVTGHFSINISISSVANTNFTFIIIITQNYNITFSLLTISTTPSATSTWILWLIIPIIAGLILLGIAYVKFSKKLELQRMRGYMEEKLDLVRELVNAGKFREAISYCYHILVQIATLKYELDNVKESCTIREFIDMLITEKSVSKEIAFPFMMNVLESIYGHAEKLSVDQVADVVSLLGNLYMDITKDMTQSFKL